MAKHKVLVATPGQDVKLQEIDGDMSPVRNIVGGSFECVRLGNGYMLYSNQNGIDQDLPVNPHFAQGIVKGPFVIAKAAASGNPTGLDEGDIPYVMDTFIRH